VSPPPRPDDHITRGRPAVSIDPLTAEQLEFARVLGRLLAERWASRDPSAGWPTDSVDPLTTSHHRERKSPNSP
jgi:hypothetical protein